MQNRKLITQETSAFIKGTGMSSLGKVLLHPASFQLRCNNDLFDAVDPALFRSQEKLVLMHASLEQRTWADAKFYGYEAVVLISKAFLVVNGIARDLSMGILNQFEKEFSIRRKEVLTNFDDLALRNVSNTDQACVEVYAQEVDDFYKKVAATILK